MIHYVFYNKLNFNKLINYIKYKNIKKYFYKLMLLIKIASFLIILTAFQKQSEAH